MLEDEVATADVLEIWREASRAAELADRWSELAHTTAERADLNAAAAEEIATLAEQVAESAAAAATRARSVATQARARKSHDGPLTEAAAEQTGTHAVEAEAAMPTTMPKP